MTISRAVVGSLVNWVGVIALPVHRFDQTGMLAGSTGQLLRGVLLGLFVFGTGDRSAFTIELI